MNLSFGKRILVPFYFVLLFAFCWLGTWICSCFFSLSLRTIPQLILRGGSFISLLWLLFSLLTAWEHRVHTAGKTLIFFLRILLILFSLLAGTFLALLEAFAFTPEHAVVKYEIPMVARVHSFWMKVYLITKTRDRSFMERSWVMNTMEVVEMTLSLMVTVLP